MLQSATRWQGRKSRWTLCCKFGIKGRLRHKTDTEAVCRLQVETAGNISDSRAATNPLLGDLHARPVFAGWLSFPSVNLQIDG